MKAPLLVLATLLAPSATAADLLASEVEWGPETATLIVRAAGPTLRVSAEPPVLVAGPDGAPASTPLELAANGSWRGMTGVVELALHRRDPEETVDVVIEDASGTGLWIEWPAAPRATPLPAILAGFALLAAAAVGRR